MYSLSISNLWYVESREDPELESDDIYYGFRLPTFLEAWQSNPFWVSRTQYISARIFFGAIQITSIIAETFHIMEPKQQQLLKMLTRALEYLNLSLLPLHTILAATIEMDRLYLLHLMLSSFHPLSHCIDYYLNKTFERQKWTFCTCQILTFLVNCCWRNPTWVMFIQNFDNAIRLNDVQEEEILKQLKLPWMAQIIMFTVLLALYCAVNFHDETYAHNSLFYLWQASHKSLLLYMFLSLTPKKRCWYYIIFKRSGMEFALLLVIVSFLVLATLEFFLLKHFEIFLTSKHLLVILFDILLFYYGASELNIYPQSDYSASCDQKGSLRLPPPVKIKNYYSKTDEYFS